MFENNKLATQKANVAFQLRAISQLLKLMFSMYKDQKDEVNSIKQQCKFIRIVDETKMRNKTKKI
jgi:hypothetical protein